MRDDRGFLADLLRPGTTACAVFCGVLGILAALSMLALGFWVTVLIIAFFGLGFFLGAVRDKRAFFQRVAAWFLSFVKS